MGTALVTAENEHNLEILRQYVTADETPLFSKKLVETVFLYTKEGEDVAICRECYVYGFFSIDFD